MDYAYLIPLLTLSMTLILLVLAFLRERRDADRPASRSDERRGDGHAPGRPRGHRGR